MIEIISVFIGFLLLHSLFNLNTKYGFRKNPPIWFAVYGFILIISIPLFIFHPLLFVLKGDYSWWQRDAVGLLVGGTYIAIILKISKNPDDNTKTP